MGQDRIVDVSGEHDHPVEVVAAQHAVVEARFPASGQQDDHGPEVLLRSGLAHYLDER
jgi:hypothetical protein